MFDRQQFLASMRGETEICKHLYGKIPAGTLDYRPGENMRTTLELLRYLPLCGRVPTTCFIHDSWGNVKEMIATTATMDAAEFPARMDAQMKAVEDELAGVSDEDLLNRTVTAPWGGELALGQALIECSLKFMAAYRMQLFLYAKAAGASRCAAWPASGRIAIRASASRRRSSSAIPRNFASSSPTTSSTGTAIRSRRSWSGGCAPAPIPRRLFASP